ncbi:MAG: glycosyltransferase family 4 protein [Verrucomicrobiota bacterium]|nr:glycosyltransferase family 4 protein [Verrucomicrobiota bacterium]
MRLGYVFSRYPVWSQTFCDREMLELERRDHELVLASFHPPESALRHAYLGQLRAQPHYAPDSRALDALARKAKKRGRWPEQLIARHEKKYGVAYKPALRARNAVFLADLFAAQGVRHCHVHFANRAAHTALFLKEITGITFSVTAHGQDFMSDLGNAELLQEIFDGAEFIAAETDFSAALLRPLQPGAPAKIVRVYNGIDLSRFPAAETRATSADTIRILSVGRLVPIKGFEILIDACARLRDGALHFQCDIIGDGAMRGELAARVSRRDLAICVRFLGERSSEEVIAALGATDIFVLASIVDDQGASDVFPTVIAEAMACACPVVASAIAGIPELVDNNRTGLLIPPHDARMLADAIMRLARDPPLRAGLGKGGRQRIAQAFQIQSTIEPLLARLHAATRCG